MSFHKSYVEGLTSKVALNGDRPFKEMTNSNGTGGLRGQERRKYQEGAGKGLVRTHEKAPI